MASPRIQGEIDEAIQTLQTASQSGVGGTLRRIRVNKALTALHKVENSCTTERDSGHVKGQILLVQCMLIDEICKGETGQQDRAELYYHMEEALALWTWLHTHPEDQWGNIEITTAPVVEETPAPATTEEVKPEDEPMDETAKTESKVKKEGSSFLSKLFGGNKQKAEKTAEKVEKKVKAPKSPKSPKKSKETKKAEEKKTEEAPKPPKELAPVAEEVFGRCLSDVLTKRINRPDREDLLHGIQIRLTKAHRAYKDPFLMTALFETSHTILQDCLDRANSLYGSGSWVLALSLLTSKDAELDELVELEEKLEAYPNFVAHGLGYKQRDAGVIREEYQALFSSCKCSQLIHFGDLHFKEALNGDPEDIFARGLLAQDDFRAALQYAVGQDIELEGTVLVRLALFHAKISKVPVTAHQLYLRAVQLAAALQPALPKGPWYKKAVDAVQAHRDALEAEEAKKWEHARKPILEKLSSDMDKLNGAKKKEDAEYVKFVFETWPPKTEGGPNPPLDPADPNTLSKKQLLKAIQRYHTDKNSAWGDEWRVLSEEIAKTLTARYNTMKGL